MNEEKPNQVEENSFNLKDGQLENDNKKVFKIKDT